jgi:hypothetical protein
VAVFDALYIVQPSSVSVDSSSLFSTHLCNEFQGHILNFTLASFVIAVAEEFVGLVAGWTSVNASLEDSAGEFSARVGDAVATLVREEERG